MFLLIGDGYDGYPTSFFCGEDELFAMGNFYHFAYFDLFIIGFIGQVFEFLVDKYPFCIVVGKVSYGLFICGREFFIPDDIAVTVPLVQG